MKKYISISYIKFNILLKSYLDILFNFWGQ